MNIWERVPLLRRPAGAIVIIDIADADPKKWTTSKLDIIGLAELYLEDPDPKNVDINNKNIAIMTLQECNHLILLNLTSKSVINHFRAQTVDWDHIDTGEDD